MGLEWKEAAVKNIARVLVATIAGGLLLIPIASEADT